jgi:hypothetical protein
VSRILLLVCVVCSSLAMANDKPDISVADPLAFTSDILTHQPDSVFFRTDERIYLRPEKIHPTSRGIFIGDQGTLIEIPFLCSDRMGCYVPSNNRLGVDYTGYWVCWNDKCKNYGKVWRSKSQYCPVCRESGQPS